MALALIGEKTDRSCLIGKKIENNTFFNCDFSNADLSGTELIDCQFYDRESQKGCDFGRTMLKDAILKSCNLSMADFRNASVLGTEIRHCRVQGADFRGASFMNMITTRIRFCSAYITNTGLSYANFSKVVLEKCELWENCWMGARVLSMTFSGSGLPDDEFSTFGWRTANFIYCDSVNSESGGLDIRDVDLQGVKLDNYQASLLMERPGIAIIGWSSGNSGYSAPCTVFYPLGIAKEWCVEIFHFLPPHI